MASAWAYRHSAAPPASWLSADPVVEERVVGLDVLQRFLTARMFDVAGEDARANRLRDTASDLAGVLKGSPERTAAFTMVAIDGYSGIDEPVVVEVMKFLENRWQSYAGAFSDEKLPTVARAVVLQALAGSMSADSIAACVALTARNMLPHIGAQADRELWGELLSEADARLDARAQREWALSPAAKSEELVFSLDTGLAVKAPKAPEQWLASRMSAAVGPNGASGDAPKPPVNGNWPSNNGQQWSYEFAPIAADAIAQAINHVASSLVTAINEQRAPQAMADAITSYVGNAAQALARTTAALERRTTLLWWKEALYSPSAKTSYRHLDPAVAAALIAIDASAQTGAFAPGMAESLVRETARAIDPGTMTDAKPLVGMCSAILAEAEPLRGAIRDGLSQVHIEPGRTPLASLLGRGEAVTGDVLRIRLGLGENLLIAPEDLCLWLFRDLQAAAATPQLIRRKRAQRG